MGRGVTAQGFVWTERQAELAAFLARTSDALVYGGAGGGKTFGIIGAIVARALAAPGSRHLAARHRFNHAKASLLRQTLPEVMKLAYPSVDVSVNTQDGIVTLSTKRGESEIWIAGLDDKDRLEKILGTSFATIYLNEASQIAYEAFLTVKTRLRQKSPRIDGREQQQRLIVDLNPGPDTHWTAQRWLERVEPQDKRPLSDVQLAQMGVFTMSPLDNAGNLPPAYIEDLRNLPARQRKRFFDGEYQGDVDGALWRRSIIGRLTERPVLGRTIVAVDPAISTEVGSDETGIVGAGMIADRPGHAVVLDDDSGRYDVGEWARRAVGMWRSLGADCIVAEANQGGEMVRQVIEAERGNVPVRLVRATRGKWLRAEPVAALYERGKVFHCGVFDRLEDQMCAMTPDFDRKSQGYSPDRVDALVWGLTDLFPNIAHGAAAPDRARYRQTSTCARTGTR
ncbi:MAG: phage terminase large subunit, partial [Pseudomonadota bacterium]